MSGPRYSVLPYQFFDDTRPKMSHVRVMASLCRHTNRSGWCRLRQGSISEEAGVSRQAVNRALADLVKWGHVEIHEKEKGRSKLYRVIMDSRAEPPDDLPEEDLVVGGVSSGEDIPPTSKSDRGVTPGGDRGVTSEVTTKNVSLTNTKRKDAHARSSSDFKSDLKVKGPIAAIHLRPSDASWREWQDHLRKIDQIAIADAALAAGRLTVAARWPKPTTPLPYVPTDIAPAKAGARA